MNLPFPWRCHWEEVPESASCRAEKRLIQTNSSLDSNVKFAQVHFIDPYLNQLIPSFHSPVVAPVLSAIIVKAHVNIVFTV